MIENKDFLAKVKRKMNIDIFVPVLNQLPGIIFTLVVGYIFFRQTKPVKQMGVKINTELLLKPEERLEQLEIKWRDSEIVYLYRVGVKFWNAGNTPLTRDDIVESDPIRCRFPIAEFHEIQSTRNTSNRVNGKKHSCRVLTKSNPFFPSIL